MDELEQQTREVLEGRTPTQNIFPFQVGPAAMCNQRLTLLASFNAR